MTHVEVRERVTDAQPLALLAALAVAIGYVSVHSLRAALLLPLLPLALLLLLRPVVAAATGVALLPILRSVLGSEGGAAVVSPTDTIFALALAGLIPLLLLDETWRKRLTVVRPVLLFATPYLAWLLVVLAAHPSAHTAFKTMTAVEITLLPIVLGAVAVNRRSAPWALYGFLGSAAFLAILWAGQLGTAFAGNKNAAGQYLALAILLTIILSKGRPHYLIPLPLYVVGLLYAASRGAMVAAVFGAIALLALRGLGSWRRTVAATTVLTLVVLVGYNTVPVSLQAKVTAAFSQAGGAAPAASTPEVVGQTNVERSTAYNLMIRKAYRKDGVALVEAHPLLGVGTGNYDTGSGPTRTIDPHNVLIRVAAEGGFPELVTFLFFLGGTGLLMLRRLGHNPWAGPAIAIQIAAFTHGLVDVYFVRGVPVLGWLLVGMALNPAFDRQHDAA